MNKTALGFGIGLVLIAGAVVAYLAIFGRAPEGTTPPAPAPATVTTADAAPAPAEEVEPAPAPKAEPAPAAEPADLSTLPEPPRIPQPDSVTPTKLAFTRTIPDAVDFASKETLEVLVRVELVEGNDPVRAMGMQEQIPEGFALESFDGPRQPEVKPPAGARGVLEFAWIQFPADFFPAEFSYRLKKTGATAPSPQVSGQILFRTSGEELRTQVVTSLLGTGAEPTVASPPSTTTAPKEEKAPEPPQPAMAPGAVATVSLHLARVAKEGYVPGEPVEFEVLVEQQGQGNLNAVAVVETLPAGWTFDAITGGTVPPIKPQPGKEGDLSFIFVEVPSFPLTFSYTAKPPADATGEAQVKGKVVYRAESQPMEGAVLTTTVAPKQ
jgi:hypothetical protein